MVQVAAFSLAIAAYVYLIGWLVTWGRLAGARLPVDASLPMIDKTVLFAAGLRIVLAMALVFALMCVVAYGAHTWTWQRRAPEWHDIVRAGRARAHAYALKPQLRLNDPPEVALNDRFVRIIAGFNVGVLAAALGLAGARLAKTVVDQISPGHWWALLGPWAVISIALTFLLARFLSPLRGGRVAQAIIWAAVAVVALVVSAPIGLLVLTWAAIATFGRWYARHHVLPASKLEFVLSPLPWVLLTIYAFVGLAYNSMPPVSFPQTVVNTPSGLRLGGYLAHTRTGVFLVSCKPLADATSTDETVSVVPAGEVQSTATSDTPFTLDAGYRPSLLTLALHAFGINENVPTWIRPELKTRRATCAGAQPPRPSVGYEAPQLGSAVFAGPAPPGGRARDGEPPVEQTTPGIARLARRFQPTILATVADRFWPVSVGAVLEDVGTNGQPTCLYRVLKSCAVIHPKLTDLHGLASAPGDFLEYPATPALDRDPTGQFNAFVRGQRGRQTPVPSLHRWLADPGVLDPWSTAQVYFYYAGPVEPLRWPAPNPSIPAGLIGLQYWFFYPYNYYPTVATPDLMNEAPIAGDVVNTDLHQGDWEHVTVLLEPKTLVPRWLYMARHSDEGAYFPWNSPLLSFDEGHLVVQAAFGGHPTYDPRCGGRMRFAHRLGGRVSDWVVCGSGRFAFRAATTPLADIANTPWACWKGHFGVATPSEVAAARLDEDSVQRAIDKYYYVAGPRSPLWQAENGHLSADGNPPRDAGVCANSSDPRAPELAATRAGLGVAGHRALARKAL
jgi:hypothetical protein